MSDKQISREERRKAIERQKKTNNKKKKKSPAVTWIKRIVLAIVAIGIAGFVFGASLFVFYASSAPEIDEELLRDPISPTFYAADGETEIPYITAENREYVNYEDIPKSMEAAILATEDNRFYEHSGIDVIRLGGAVIANITGGFGSQGASTITQQVIKNSFLTNDKTLKRKAQEAYLAFKLEQEYEKEEIFEMYFNKILMSGNIYGFGTASEYFYGKPLSELTLSETALLAGMPQSPNGYNPFKNPERAEERRNVVLSLMDQHEKISTEEKEQAQAVPVADSLVPEGERQQQTPNVEYTVFMEMVEDELEALEGDYSLDEGLTIYTTLEPYVQTKVNEAMASDLFFDDTVQSAMTVVDTKTGGISAVGAAREYTGDVRHNYATAKDRAVGSTIKPLLDYGPAIEYLDWSTGQTVVDEPYSYEDNDQEIRNVDGEFLGTMTIREALYRSRNIPAVKTLQEVDTENAGEFMSKIGLNMENIYESTALGAANFSTVEMAGAYATFGNQGEFNKPHTIKKIVFRDGSTEQVVAPEPVQAMKDSTAFMVTDMLRDVVDLNVPGATGKEVAINGLDMAGKTGTTNYSAEKLEEFGLDSSSALDVWFAGYTTDYSISVWSGYPDRKTPIDTASNERLLSQRLFKNVMSEISSPETARFEQPESVTEQVVEVGSEPLKLASAFTPYSLRSSELFARGTEPNSVSQRYIVEDLDTPTRLRATVEGDSAELSWNYSDNDVSFEVSVEVDGSRTVLNTSSSQSYTFNGLEEGKSYTFRVVAVNSTQRSDPASTVVEVAAAPEEPEEEPAEEPVEEEPVEEEPVEEEPVEEEPVEEEPVEEEPVEEEPVEEEPVEEEPVEEEPAEDAPIDVPEDPTEEEENVTPSVNSSGKSNRNENDDGNSSNDNGQNGDSINEDNN
ncbi:penicillin-binding protein 1A/1B (PBP1) [Planococcus antarcticus DSM 14505]|uniref:Penicillin-binding protein n=1 Tax=Planococcus antarcticus DSM 14505 TaxID=1185653 RepID=A0A1C7DH07_9BACL|nr:PBP1A family penicillin-binding protein [Planococcus antarcticus]ANU10698.1 penicillin-binding protein [Planococcus antarcticus DSM 14505]EIM06786.1 penicillin-binding protein 1A/1B (PBP1) [Planococcus antarcticus DSM 14505]